MRNYYAFIVHGRKNTAFIYDCNCRNLTFNVQRFHQSLKCYPKLINLLVHELCSVLFM